MGPFDQAAIPGGSEEAERLQDLSDLGLAGQPDAPDLAGIPELAAQVCGRPWAGVSLVQEDVHRFLAKRGPLPDALPRELSVCSHAIQRPDELFEVEDLASTPPFDENPLITEAGARFYAGAPIQGPRGFGLGTVCVYDDEPGCLREGEREALSILAGFVSLHLSLHHRTGELERANEELDRFTTFVSHELTDPLTQIVSNLELLEMDLADAEEEVREQLEDAKEGAERMDRLIKDLLRYGRASGRPLDLGVTDLEGVAEAVRGDLAHRLEAPERQIRVGDLPEVHADERLVRRVVENLVRNGLEHGDRPIRITSEDGGEVWRIWVEDEGAGIDPDDQEGLFELFQTGEDPTSESTGVGLALAKRIVERHGGDIGVDPEPGEGARFWFTLPKPPVNGGR